MRNVVGQTPRGTDFFPRNAIINKIYRRLDSGENLFLAAPRRVGKTAIMRAMEDNPRNGFQFVYIITESISDVEEYYHKLLTATLHSEALSNLAQKKESIKNVVREIAGNISIKLPWIELQVFFQRAIHLCDKTPEFDRGKRNTGNQRADYKR